MRDLEFNINARDRTKAGFDEAEARARRFNSQIDKTASAYNLAGTAAKAFAAAFTIGAIEGFGRYVKGVIKDAADLVDMADKVGIATGDLQRLQFGFQLAGVEAGDVDGILTQWSKRIGEAYSSGGKLANMLKANGVALTDSEGRLRSSVELMRSYADLVAKAGSDQERQVLANLAFGRAGDAMVLALKDGAAGFDELMRKADEAGGVLNDEVLRKAAEIDDAFDVMWRNFEIGAKSAILAAVTGFDALGKSMAQNGIYGQFKRYVPPQLVPEPSTQIDVTKGDRLPGQERFDSAFGPVSENPLLVKLLQQKFAPRSTIIPDDTSARKASTAAAKEQVSAYDKVMQSLQAEQAQIGMTTTGQKIMSELRKADVSALSEQGQAIAKLVSEIERQKAAQEALNENIEFMKSSTGSFLTTFRQNWMAGASAIDAARSALSGFFDTLLTRIEQMAADKLITSFMGSLFGTSSGGLLSVVGGGGNNYFPPAPKAALPTSAAASANQTIVLEHRHKMINDGLNIRQEVETVADERVAKHTPRMVEKGIREYRTRVMPGDVKKVMSKPRDARGPR